MQNIIVKYLNKFRIQVNLIISEQSKIVNLKNTICSIKFLFTYYLFYQFH